MGYFRTGLLYQIGDKIALILNIITHASGDFNEIYSWANGIKLELLRITDIDISEFGLLSEFLFMEHKKHDWFLAEDWGLVDTLKNGTRDFEVINRVVELNRYIHLLKLELEKEKNKKKRWF